MNCTATVKSTTTMVKKVVETEVPVVTKTVTVTMDEQTAKHLKAILGNLSGYNAVRRSCDNVYHALGRAIGYNTNEMGRFFAPQNGMFFASVKDE